MKFAAIVCVALLTTCDAGMFSIGSPKLRIPGRDSCRHAEGFAAFLEEHVNATKRPDDIPDPSCKQGVVSPDLKACCTDECGSCGQHALCDDIGKYHEQTGKLAGNCCKDRVMKSGRSCDKTHPPCVLSPDYAKELDTYKIDRPSRHAMDDCNKAMDIAREKHGLGIEKGEFLAELYLQGRTKYQDALEIAVKVDHLCEKEILKVETKEYPLKDKMAKATAADKEVDPMTGTSQYLTWENELEANENQINFYKDIIKNAKRVKAESVAGIKNVDDLKKEVLGVTDIQPFQLKLDTLVEDGNRVYREAEFLWKQWIDSGKDYDCSAPPVVEHAASQCTSGNTKFSFKCDITCEVGYDGNQSKNLLKCLKQGKFGKELYGEWQGMASCVGRMCGMPPKIEGSKFAMQKIRYPNQAHYICHEGRTTDSTPLGPKVFTIACGDKGNFLENHTHKCMKIKCGSAPAFPNTEKVPGVFYYADVVNYQCLEGYSLDEQPGGISNFSVSCESSGKFTTNKECQRVRCGPPPDFDHTIEKSKKAETRYGDEVSFECRPGYSIDQRPQGPKEFTLQCGANGEFKVKGASPELALPECQPVSAGMSPKIDHGDLPSREMFYGQDALVTADLGYSYDATPTSGLSFTLEVTTEGTYANVHEFKPVECGAPPSVKKAVAKFTKNMAVYGDILPYDCESGYSTDATDREAALSFSLVCESDADFSKVPDKGECVNIDDCLQHSCGPFGACQDELNDYKCICEPGFEQEVDDVSGEKVCGNINDCGPEACGVGKCKDLIEAYQCICPEGYEEIGDGPMDKTCAAKTCGTPPSVENAATSPLEDQVSKAFYTNRITYQCDAGHTTNGKAGGHNHFSINCQADTTFSAAEACQPVQCGVPPTVEKATSPQNAAVFNQSVKFKCENGYTIDGTNEGDKHFTIKCQANGLYTDPGTCKPVVCGSPPEVANAFVESGDIHFPNKVAYKCFEGFSLDGQADGKKSFEVECKASGNLTKAKQCTAVVCGEPPKHIHALFATASNEGEVYYPQVTEVTCRDGYTVGGEATGNKSFGVKCLSTGKFAKYDERECEPVRCGAVPDFENAELVSVKGGDPDNLNFEETATYGCWPGFTAGGEADAPATFDVECLATGAFSYPSLDQRCRNVDACQQHTCGPKGSCIDTIGESIDAYTCNCSYGFAVKMVDGEKFCGNIDDCGSHKCGTGVCKDLIGDYTCICPAGHFVGFLDNEKTCVPVKCVEETPKLGNGTMLSDHKGAVNFPETLRYECNDGYSTDGSVADATKKFQAHCKADGTLYGMMSCQPVSCGTPRSLPFTRIVGSVGPQNSVDYGETVEYECMEGYTVGGKIGGETTFETKCQASGVLADPLVCDPINCGTPPDVPHATPHIMPEVFYGMRLQYFCNHGYTLDGTRHGLVAFDRRCLSTGGFEPISHGCKPISAGEVPQIENAILTEYNGVVASTMQNYPHLIAYYPDGVEYHCKDGYTLSGGTGGLTKFVAYATAAGDLQPPLPEKCLPIAFEARGLVKNARNGQGLDGATERILGTDITARATNGYFTLSQIPPGTYTVKYEANGYIPVEREIQITGNINVGGVMDISMSPAMGADEWRAVLKWNARPTDLDTYAMWGYSKVCWYGRNKLSGNMQGILEHDDTDGYGPETLHLSKVGKCTGSSSTCDIEYKINDYTKSKTMLEKGASVTLYHGDGVEGTWDIKDCASSVEANLNWWHVFTIDGRTNRLKWNCKSPPEPPITPGILEQVYYFQQGENVPNLNSRTPNMQRVVYAINYDKFNRDTWSGFSNKDNYAVRWQGSIRINSQGTYTFYLTSDDGSQMWIDNDMVVNNGGLHSKQTKSADVSLSSDLHAVKIDYFEKDGDAGCVFEYKGRDTNNEKKVVPQSALRTNPVLDGLTEEVFYFDQGDALSDLNGREPNMARKVDTVDYAETDNAFPGFNKANQFAVRYTGFVVINVPGEYEFTIGSDDGSKLFIEDEQLIANDGAHSYKELSGSKTLTTGYKSLRLEYFEKDGGASIVLKYKGPDTNNAEVVIPKDKLKKAAGTPLVIDVNAGLKELVYYYGGNPRDNGDNRYDMPWYNGKTPQKVSTVSYVNYGSTDNKWGGFSQKDNFAVRFTGSMVVRNSGSYNLQIESDDGSLVWWSDEAEPLLKNGGLHGMQKKSATRSMNKGTAYALRIDYFEEGGGAGCKFSYKGPDTGNEMKIVPRRALLTTSALTGLFMEAFYLNSVEFMGNDRRYELNGRDDGGSIKALQTWQIRSYDEAEAKCLGNKDCKAFCHNPDDWSVFYPRWDQGYRSVGNYGAGWKCYKIPGYQGDSLPDMKNWSPFLQKMVPKIDWAESENKWSGFRQATDFACRFTGSIVINHAGNYKFWIGSDDGSKMYITDSNDLLINNDGLHSYQEKEGNKDLSEGETTIMINYFQKEGGSAMRFFWQGQDTGNSKVIVSSALRRIAGPQ